MIKINLHAKKGGGKRAGAQSDVMAQLRGLDVQSLTQFPILKIVLPLICAYLADNMFETYKEEELATLTRQQQVLRAEQSKLQKTVAETKKYDEIKKQIEKDEELINQKLWVMKRLVEERRTPPLLMSSISRAIPSDVWLSEMKIGPKEATFRGSSIGFNPISDFMQNLGSNEYFAEVGLKNSNQVKDDSGNEIASFELSAQRRVQQ